MLWTAPTPLDYFETLVADDTSLPLLEAAISLGQDEVASLDVQAVLAQVDRLCATLRARLDAEAGPLQRVRALHRYLYEELGLRGNVNDFYNPDNSYIHQVLESRRGIPISLAVIYLELAAAVGLSATGVSFPGHFLVRLKLPLGDAVIDPLDGQSLGRDELEDRLGPYLRQRRETGRGLGAEAAGRVPDAQDVLAPYLKAATPRDILARMLHNLEAVHRDADDLPRLLQAQQRLVVLLPDAWDVRRDRGLTLARLGQTEAAIEDLALYLHHSRATTDRLRIKAQLDALRESGPPRWH
jgi:regulator of sirC expression with transglutaminase-like and TPR domain